MLAEEKSRTRWKRACSTVILLTRMSANNVIQEAEKTLASLDHSLSKASQRGGERQPPTATARSRLTAEVKQAIERSYRFRLFCRVSRSTTISTLTRLDSDDTIMRAEAAVNSLNSTLNESRQTTRGEDSSYRANGMIPSLT